MSFARCLRGLRSGVAYPFDQPMNLDPLDGRPVQIELDLARLAAERPQHSWYQPQRRSMWRFGGLLALDYDDPSDRAHIGELCAGGTGEIDASWHPVAQALDLALSIKEEGRPLAGFGHNPTLSFKDRGMAMSVAMARKLGLRRLAVPTQGNAGDSLVHFALQAGLEVVVVMPEDTPMPILGQVAARALMYPDQIRLELVKGTIREAGQRIREHWLPQGWFSVATFQEPGWRIEGKKTLGLELAEPRKGTAHWSVPDAIIYPTGGGTGVLGMWKAFDELQALGLIDSRRPRFYCVQSEVTTPLVRAFASGAADTEAQAPLGPTLSTGLNVPGGVGHFRVLDIIRASGGSALAVSEAATAAALHSVWSEQRLWLSPEGAACLAALPVLQANGALRKGERVVVVNTGAADKYLTELRHLLD
jgi:threonine synthase